MTSGKTEESFGFIKQRISKLIKVIATDDENDNPLAIQILTQSLIALNSIEKELVNYEQIYSEELQHV